MTEADTQSRASRIPTFATREEEAEFWDTHDITDYWDELEPAELVFDGPFSEPVTLHIDPETMDEVRAAAAERGLPADGLLHVWILERRDAERRRRQATVARSAASGEERAPGAARSVRRTA